MSGAMAIRTNRNPSSRHGRFRGEIRGVRAFVRSEVAMSMELNSPRFLFGEIGFLYF